MEGLSSSPGSRAIRKESGFTITELAVVLLIVALLIGGLLVPLSSQMDVARSRETQRTLEDLKESMIGHAISNGRLPCPDTNLDGAEDNTTTVTDNIPLAGQSTQTISCTAAEGGFPFQTLGMPRTDAWGQRFRYRITATFGQRTIVWSGLGATGSQVGSSGFTLSQNGNITISTRGDDLLTAGVTESKALVTLAAGAVAVIISHGKNGFGGVSDAGTPLVPPPGANVDETTNATDGATKISKVMARYEADCSDTTEGKPPCEFDDVIAWLPRTILFSRMIAAGQLP